MSSSGDQRTLSSLSKSVRSCLRGRTSTRNRPSVFTARTDYNYLPLSNTSPVRPTHSTPDETSVSPPVIGNTPYYVEFNPNVEDNALLSFPTPHEDFPARDAECGDSRMGSLTTEKSGLPIGWLYASVAAVAYVYSLDQNITPNYLPIAASAYGKHSSIGTIFTVESIINGVSKPFIAKIADVISRPSACMCSLVFYTAGYLMIALSSSITHVITGCMLYTVGHSGLNLVTDIIVADISSLKWRGFVLSLTGLPFLVNTFIGAEIVNAVLKRNAWRWGYGMFVIILPVVTLPAIYILHHKHHHRRMQSVSQNSPSNCSAAGTKQLEDEDGTYWNRLKNVIVRMDFGGLVLIGISFSLLLLPLTLAKSAQRDWTHPSMLVMTVLGVLFISVFMLNERLWTQYPLFPSRFIRNRTLLIIIFIDFLYFMSGWMRTNYLSSYVYIVKDWTPREWSYFNNATTFSLCILGPVAGLIQRYTHRYKTLQVTGLSIRLMGMILTTLCSSGTASSHWLVASQVLIGAGGAFNVAGSRVASQASVPHTDLASVVAILALCTQFGSATGSATATKLWRTTLVPCLIKYLPWLTNEEIQELFGSISKVRQYPYNDPVRQGVIKAYEETARPLWLWALFLSIPPIIAALFLPNYYLGDTHNVIEGTSLPAERRRPRSRSPSSLSTVDGPAPNISPKQHTEGSFIQTEALRDAPSISPIHGLCDEQSPLMEGCTHKSYSSSERGDEHANQDGNHVEESRRLI